MIGRFEIYSFLLLSKSFSIKWKDPRIFKELGYIRMIVIATLPDTF